MVQKMKSLTDFYNIHLEGTFENISSIYKSFNRSCSQWSIGLNLNLSCLYFKNVEAFTILLKTVHLLILRETCFRFLLSKCTSIFMVQFDTLVSFRVAKNNDLFLQNPWNVWQGGYSKITNILSCPKEGKICQYLGNMRCHVLNVSWSWISQFFLKINSL